MLGRMFGAGLGWAFAGPIGGLIGWWLGGQVDANPNMGQGSGPRISQQTRPGDFAIAMLVLLAAVMKADGKVVKAELDYVKQFLIKSFGRDNAQEMLVLLKNLLEQDYYIYEIANQINRHMNIAEKMQLIHVLFGISQADGEIHASEVEIIQEIGQHLKLNASDVDAIMAIFVKDNHSAYKILEINSSASDQELKKAYRSMARRFHPDKVQHLGPEFQTMAEAKFKAINEAYQQIKTDRGL
ncbi:MAG: molecular chaperone DjiA [Candidatus Marinimicrobia bacterium]|jgi:DnaJ like chaperone protein|nr:molecular chaperone DjiA [Candidatus Neomarinimicrobiota bacterium]MBT4715371.1 molecular chaperone DjiA [Candidatus Neomarinimicrobiota bacterium]MBT4946817.1 molecular chaperone DjiA [Candidatus Neomarinimicrobiota bacterium]MBT5268617.1 molecular chaperone DjiA [Candidatus Neomarinimicrobiota bacterium]MBT6010153.1 molecular chaperone DjiA [Candidatus Neomarinimicrobiota bacterium]